MKVTLQRAAPLRGTLVVPPDKAICHRAVLVCALTQGSTEITPWSSADDCRHTLELLKGLGVHVLPTPRGIRIDGVGLRGLRAPRVSLDCGESGTTMRLVAGLLAGQPFDSRLLARGSLQHRPMRRIIEPLSEMGARIQGIPMPEFEGDPAEAYPPLEIFGQSPHPPLHGIRYTLPVASAQVKSAILIAGLFARGSTTVTEPVPTRDHTERLLSRLGVSIRRTAQAITLEPPQRELAMPGELAIPGDLSGAAFFIVAAAIVPDSRLSIADVGLNPTRTRFVEVLRRMGASIQIEAQADEWEPRGTISVAFAPLSATRISASEVPVLIDELPVLLVAACAAKGESRFEGLGELRVKETDRLHSMVTGLKAMGGNLLLSPDGSLIIEGGQPLQGEFVDSFQDHRTAMSLAVAGLVASGTTTVNGAACVAKSFPEFFEHLRRVAGPSTVKTVDTVVGAG